MKKKSFLLLGGGAAVAAIVIIACAIALSGSDKYKRLIPATADVVVRLNVADATDKAGITSKEGLDIMRQWLDKINDDRTSQFKKYLESPEDMGLRLDHDIYIFGSVQQECGGMVIEMYKTEKFKSFVEDLMKSMDQEASFSEHDNLTWVETRGAGGAVAFNDDYCVIYISKDCQADIVKLASLPADEQYIKTDRYKHLKDMDGQAAMDINFGMIPDREFARYTELFKQFYGEDFSMKDINVAYGINLQKGKVEMNAEYYTDNAKLNEIIDKAYAAYGTIDGKFIENNSHNLLAWMGMNYDGKKALELYEALIKDLPVPDDVKSALDLVETTLSSIDGDVALAVDNAPSAIHKSFSLDLRAEVNDKSVAQKFTEGIYKISPQLKQIVTQRKDEYVVTVPFLTKGEPLARYGVKDGNLFVTTAKSDETNKTKLSDWKSTIKDSYVFLYVDLTVAHKLLLDETSEHYVSPDMRAGLAGLSLLKDAVCYSTKKNKVTMAVNLADDDQTLMQFVSEILKSAHR